MRLGDVRWCTRFEAEASATSWRYFWAKSRSQRRTTRQLSSVLRHIGLFSGHPSGVTKALLMSRFVTHQ